MSALLEHWARRPHEILREFHVEGQVHDNCRWRQQKINFFSVFSTKSLDSLLWRSGVAYYLALELWVLTLKNIHVQELGRAQGGWDRSVTCTGPLACFPSTIWPPEHRQVVLVAPIITGEGPQKIPPPKENEWKIIGSIHFNYYLLDIYWVL